MGAIVPRPGSAVGDVIEMDPQFGQAMGLRAGQKVKLTEEAVLQEIERKAIEPFYRDPRIAYFLQGSRIFAFPEISSRS